MSRAPARWFAASLAFAAIGAITSHPAGHGWWPISAQAIPAAPSAPPTDWTSPPTPARDRWLSWNPIPIGTAVSGFWATAPDDVWAWGDKEIMRWNGRAWSRVDAPVLQPIDAIWGAPNDVWLHASHYTPEYHSRDLIIAGEVQTSLLHWNGRGWRSVESRSFSEDGHGHLPPSASQLAPPPDPAKVVGRDELTELWRRHVGGRDPWTFKAGYRTGGDQLWAVDVDGRRIAHFDGRNWTVGERLASSDFSAVRMISATEGWAVSRRPVSYAGYDAHLGGPTGDGLFRWDGRSWRFVRPLAERVYALWSSGADDVWAVGQNGLVMHWDGGRWSERRLSGDFHAIWGRSSDDVWINGCANNFYHWNGATWSRAPNPISADHVGVCLALGGTSATDVLAIRDARFLQWTGVAWQYAPNPLRAADPSARDVRISAFWSAPTSGDLWAVGQEGGLPLVLRRRAGRWTKLPTPPTEGHSSSWARVGEIATTTSGWSGTKGLILHWDGTSWSKEESGVVEQLSAIHGAGGIVWIVGDRGTVLVRSLQSPGSG